MEMVWERRNGRKSWGGNAWVCVGGEERRGRVGRRLRLGMTIGYGLGEEKSL